MIEDVEKILLKYKEYTINIIDLLKKDEFDSISSKMERRQCILNKLIAENCKKNEVKEVYNRLNINEIENEAKELMYKKALLVKKKLKDISVKKTANSAYGNIGSSAKIFSKKI